MFRTNNIILYAAGRGTGKTTDMLGNESLKIKGFIPFYQDKHPDMNILVVDINDHPMYRHIYTATNPKDLKKSTLSRIYSPDPEILWEVLDKHCYNSLVIIEDATRFVGKTLSDIQKRIVLDTKQKNIDLVFLFHCLTAIPNDLIRYSDLLVLKKTGENYSTTIREKYPQPALKEALETVFNSTDDFVSKTLYLR